MFVLFEDSHRQSMKATHKQYYRWWKEKYEHNSTNVHEGISDLNRLNRASNLVPPRGSSSSSAARGLAVASSCRLGPLLAVGGGNGTPYLDGGKPPPKK